MFINPIKSVFHNSIPKNPTILLHKMKLTYQKEELKVKKMLEKIKQNEKVKIEK